MIPIAREPLAFESKAPLGKTAVACRQCQAVNPADARFCNQCGAPIKASTCPGCGAEIVAEARFCNQCGQAVE